MARTQNHTVYSKVLLCSEPVLETFLSSWFSDPHTHSSVLVLLVHLIAVTLSRLHIRYSSRWKWCAHSFFCMSKTALPVPVGASGDLSLSLWSQACLPPICGIGCNILLFLAHQVYLSVKGPMSCSSSTESLNMELLVTCVDGLLLDYFAISLSSPRWALELVGLGIGQLVSFC